MTTTEKPAPVLDSLPETAPKTPVAHQDAAKPVPAAALQVYHYPDGDQQCLKAVLAFDFYPAIQEDTQ